MKHIDLTNKRGSAKELALTPGEKKLLLENLKDVQDRIILLLACWAGMRVEEIGQCRSSWIEWSRFGIWKVLKIKIPGEDKDTRRPYKKFKQKKEWKTAIYIFDNEVANEIWFFFQNNKEGLKMSRQNITQYRVCGRTKNGKWIPGHFSKIIDRKITTHALRATFTNYMTEEFRFPNNIEPKVTFVKTQLRHKDFRTTMSHYKTETIAQQEAYLEGVLKEK